MGEKMFTVGQAAELVGVNPKVITDAIYRGPLQADRCSIVSGRRQIPESYMLEVRAFARAWRARQQAAASATK